METNHTPLTEYNLLPSATFSLNGRNIHLHVNELSRQSLLGIGEFGRTEKVCHTPTGLLFAAKYLRQEYCDTPTLHRELSVGIRADCPWVVRYYCGLVSGCDLCILMELMDLSLANLLEKTVANGIAFTQSTITYVTRCVLLGLDYLHRSLHVMHRDVKPGNMLADSKGRVKVCDFGIAGFLEGSRLESYRGSRFYLAPERIKSSELGYRIQADVWSLGLCVIEFATGQKYFNGELMEVFLAVNQTGAHVIIGPSRDLNRTIENLKDEYSQPSMIYNPALKLLHQFVAGIVPQNFGYTKSN